MKTLSLFRRKLSPDTVQRITDTTGYTRLVTHLDGTVSGIKPGQQEGDRTWFARASDFEVSHG